MPHRHLLLLLFSLAAGCSGAGGPADPDAGNPSDQCLGSSDLATLSPFLADGGFTSSQDFSDLLEGCAKDSCSAELVGGTEMEAEACLAACFETTVIAGLSEGCEECLSHSVLCGMHFCTTECLGTDHDLCLSCIADNCLAARDYCTGIPSLP